MKLIIIALLLSVTVAAQEHPVANVFTDSDYVSGFHSLRHQTYKKVSRKQWVANRETSSPIPSGYTISGKTFDVVGIDIGPFEILEDTKHYDEYRDLGGRILTVKDKNGKKYEFSIIHISKYYDSITLSTWVGKKRPKNWTTWVFGEWKEKDTADEKGLP